MPLAMNSRMAILGYQFSERTKSELLIASKLLGDLRSSGLSEQIGAKRIMLLFLEALGKELGLAYNATKTSCFLEAEKRIKTVGDSIERDDYDDAVASLSEAISSVTTCGYMATRFLVDNCLL